MAWTKKIPGANGFYWYREPDRTEVVQVDTGIGGEGHPVVFFFLDDFFTEPDSLLGEFWDQPLTPPN
jgi:hypothetical protein